MKNIRSVILLAILFSILLFLVGFRLGRRVERFDKTYIPPAPTQPVSTPSATPKPFAVVAFLHEECGVSFLYPNTLEKQKESTTEAELLGNKETIQVLCEGEQVDELRRKLRETSPSATVTVANQRLLLNETDDTSSIIPYNPQTSRYVYIRVSNSLTKLVFDTLEFVRSE